MSAHHRAKAVVCAWAVYDVDDEFIGVILPGSGGFEAYALQDGDLTPIGTLQDGKPGPVRIWKTKSEAKAALRRWQVQVPSTMTSDELAVASDDPRFRAAVQTELQSLLAELGGGSDE